MKHVVRILGLSALSITFISLSASSALAAETAGGVAVAGQSNVSVTTPVTQPGDNPDGTPNGDPYTCHPAGKKKGPYSYPTTNNTDDNESADANAKTECEEKNPDKVCTATAINPQDIYVTCLGSDQATFTAAYRCDCEDKPDDPDETGGEEIEENSNGQGGSIDTGLLLEYLDSL